VLLCEAAMQAGGVLIGILHPSNDSRVPVVARMNDVRFRRAVRPGETVDLEVELAEHVAEAYYMKAKILCGGQLAARFDFTCMRATIAEA
jgi:3-hydroxyacyl-[acyl-carrier-protein] dehydratase